jgi:hypothetical protein
MKTSKDFTFVEKFSQTLIFERSLRDMSNMKNDHCPRIEDNSYTQAIFILAGNDYEEEVRFSSSNDNAMPSLFNMQGKTYKKLLGFH